MKRLQVGLAAIFTAMAGCAGLTQIQDTVTKFDQGAHAVSASEVAFLRAAQTADCNFQFYSQALMFVADKSPTPNTPLTTGAPCVPDELTNADILIRQKLLNAIALYADQIQAVASGGADKTLATNGQAAASDFNSFLKSPEINKATHTSISTTVEAAVVALFGMVMDARELSDIKKAASEQSENLTSIVDLLKKENTQVATNMTAKAGTISVILDTSIAFIKQAGVLSEVQDPGPVLDSVTHKMVDHYHIARQNDYRLLFDVVQARQIIQAVDAVGQSVTAPAVAAPVAPAAAGAGAPGAAGAPAPVKPAVVCNSATSPKAIGSSNSETNDSIAQQINGALDALVTANNAIASASSTGCLVAAITDLVTRGQAAQTMAAALKK
jgi:hypothetical protein